jgi:6-hydroxycyclohex-1-ene-1-carbonyl-CoA dehydrogenase
MDEGEREMKIRQWELVSPGEPLHLSERPVPLLAGGDVLVRVAGCGVCHTDIAFVFGGVKTRHPLPLALGHEVSGIVEDAGHDARSLVGERVVVPAVLPCGECEACRRGRGAICARQIFPGNDIPGGFASHVVVPARGLCRLPRGESALPPDTTLTTFAVLADAVTTPYQSILRSGLSAGDVAVFIGVGGVGAFGVQIAAALGASVVAIDVDADRLELVKRYGASLALDARAATPREMRAAVREHARAKGLPETEWRLFETSGTKAGQETAFSLLVPGAYLGIVGYTKEAATVPLSHLMAFDAKAEGNWGCVPELYPAVLKLVLEGKVQIAPFVEEHPLSSINEVLAQVHARKLRRRPVLVPDL